jgi:hypothetical protein
MPSIVIREPDDSRTIIYDASEADEPLEKLFRYVHLMPVEIQRIKEAKSEEVQQLLRRYI